MLFSSLETFLKLIVQCLSQLRRSLRPATCPRTLPRGGERFAVVLLLAAVVILLATPAISGDDEGAEQARRVPDFSKVRAQFEINLSKILLPELENYALQLKRLEQQFAQRSDWAGAMRTRDERLLVENRIEAARARIEPPTYVAPPNGNDDPPREIVLEARGASLDGGVSLAQDRQTLGNWTVGSQAAWSLPDIPPGGYEVIVEYASTAPVGHLQVAEQFFTLKGELASTGGLDTFQQVNLGTLRIRTPDAGLRVERLAADNNNDTAAPLRLKSLVLIPASL